MTSPTAPIPGEAPSAEATPTGVRVASTLAWLVGILTILVAIAVGVPTLVESRLVTIAPVVTLMAGVLACVAGYLVRKRNKVGGFLLVLAWASPTIVSLAGGGGTRSGNVLLFIAMVVLFFNWKHLR